MNYWEECISQSLEEHGVIATPEQISRISSDIEICHQNYGMVHGYDQIGDHRDNEIKKLCDELSAERSKVTCPDCKGSGRNITYGPYHSSESECTRCRGEGRTNQ